MKRRYAGFTMAEVLVTILIIAALAAIAIPVVLSARKTAVRAQCMENMQKVGQALIAYRQDNNVYPDADNPMGTLSTAYPNTLAKVLTCPQDPEAHYDTYGAYYNYWGYDRKASPAALRSDPDADNVSTAAHTVYTEIMDLMMLPDADVPLWEREQGYALNDVVKIAEYPGVQFRCLQSYQVINNEPQDDKKPQYGDLWQRYWVRVVPALWDNGPDADFPGLINPNTSARTIVTLCPHHIRESGNYLVLRVGGDVDQVTPPKTDVYFWALSK